MRIVLGGDVMLGRLVGDWIRTRNLDPFAHIRSVLHASDLVLINLECALTDQDTRYTGPPKAFYFRGPAGGADLLRDAGVDGVCLANNHALDAGTPGLLDTLAQLGARGIACAGAGAHIQEASRPAFFEVNGERWALIAYCNHQPDFAAGPRQAGIRFLDLDELGAAQSQLHEDIHAVLSQSDHVIVTFHWQANWAPVVLPPYRQLAKACVESGARLVWGHGPHHFQGVEWVQESAILYATGDLIDDYAIDPFFQNDRQLLFSVVLEAGRIQRVEALPIELRTGMAVVAGSEAAAWIQRQFWRRCAQVGTRRLQEVGGQLVVWPDGMSIS